MLVVGRLISECGLRLRSGRWPLAVGREPVLVVPEVGSYACVGFVPHRRRRRLGRATLASDGWGAQRHEHAEADDPDEGGELAQLIGSRRAVGERDVMGRGDDCHEVRRDLVRPESAGGVPVGEVGHLHQHRRAKRARRRN